MEQDYKIGIIGAGPAGCACAYFLSNFGIRPVLIDIGEPLRTLIPTGGGRCNLAFSEFNYRELVKYYPRGEKFLYSIFSQFSTSDTLEFMEKLGIDTYTQENGRIFPISNSSIEVREKLLQSINGCNIIKEKVLRIEKNTNNFKVITDMNSYCFDKLVYAIGGHSGYDIVKRIGVSIVEPKPSLVGFVTSCNFKSLMGTVVKNVVNRETGMVDDILFTHFGVSGPIIYKISSLYARKDTPYALTFNLCPNIDSIVFQEVLNNNPHKYIRNVISEYVPRKLAEYILLTLKINPETKAHMINGEIRDLIINILSNFQVTIKSTQKDGETVTAGGISLDKINPKTMESKEVEGLYFCGEVIDVDGFCGGFNLQNCWSTGYVAAKGLSRT